MSWDAWPLDLGFDCCLNSFVYQDAWIPTLRFDIRFVCQSCVRHCARSRMCGLRVAYVMYVRMVYISIRVTLRSDPSLIVVRGLLIAGKEYDIAVLFQLQKKKKSLLLYTQISIKYTRTILHTYTNTNNYLTLSIAIFYLSISFTS